MVYDFVPGNQIKINFETYDILGCDSGTRKALKQVYNIDVEDQYVLDLHVEEARHIVLTNKRDEKFCQAMEFDFELTWAMKDKKGLNYVLRFHKSDDNIEIYKIVGANDGVVGGKIVKKAKYVNPNTGKFFNESDFSYGSTIVVNAIT